jgi:hypothetical protein
VVGTDKFGLKMETSWQALENYRWDLKTTSGIRKLLVEPLAESDKN